MMIRKTIFLLATILFGMATASAQEVPYHPFLKEGKVWQCEMKERTTEIIGDATAYFFQTTVYDYRIDGDTVLNGVTYKKTYKTIVSVERKLLYTTPEEAAGTMNGYEYQEKGDTALNEEFLREEDQKIFIYWPPGGTELLLYDFSLAEGESTSGNYAGGSDLTVDKIETVVVQERKFRRFLLSSSYRQDLFWIEGVGHPSGPFRAYGNEVNDGKEYALLAVFEDGDCIFTKDDLAKLPEPSGIGIVDGNDGAESPRIYDLQGRRLKSAPEKGIYIRDGKKMIQR